MAKTAWMHLKFMTQTPRFQILRCGKTFRVTLTQKPSGKTSSFYCSGTSIREERARKSYAPSAPCDYLCARSKKRCNFQPFAEEGLVGTVPGSWSHQADNKPPLGPGTACHLCQIVPALAPTLHAPNCQATFQRHVTRRGKCYCARSNYKVQQIGI